MKKSYIKLIIMISISFIILLLNSFIFKLANKFTLSLFLLIILGITKLAIGFEKPRYRYIKQILFEITISLLVFFILYYLFGIIIGFYKVGNYFNKINIFNIFIPIISYTVIKEYLRYQLASKSSESKYLLALVCAFFIMLDITTAISINTFKTGSAIFKFTATVLFPMITRNILCTYLAKYYGYKPAIYYTLIMELYIYILPIVPNPDDFIYSITFLLLPIVILYRIHQFTKKTKEEKISSRVKTNKLYAYIPTVIFIVMIVYFVSGYFRFYSIVIVSGSMSPAIKRGDVVIVDQKKTKEGVQKGEVIAYRYENIIIVHRVDEILMENNKKLIYTKGDANQSRDSQIVSEEMVIGKVKFKIPVIGYPTVWYSEIGRR